MAFCQRALGRADRTHLLERIFPKHGHLFGSGQIYSTTVRRWSFLSQVLRDGQEAAWRDLRQEVATELADQADQKWLWTGRPAKRVDGFTFTLPDTPQSQASDPAPKSQKTGVGWPIARGAASLSLATASVRDLARGPTTSSCEPGLGVPRGGTKPRTTPFPKPSNSARFATT